MPAMSFYDSTGRLTGWLNGPQEQLDINKAGRLWVAGVFEPETHYVKAGMAMLRPENPTVLTWHTLRLVPAGATLTINKGAPHIVQDGAAELQFDQPGTYKVQLSCWPYLDKEFTVDNPAP